MAGEIKEIQKRLIVLVGDRLMRFGFSPKYSRLEFQKQIPDGRATFHLSFIRHSDDFDVTADVAVRFDKLEDLLNLDSPLSAKERRETYTLGADIGSLAGTGQMRWTVSDASDLDSVADAIREAFTLYALPYFSSADTMDGAFKLLSAKDRSAWLHQPFHAQRAKSVVGMAYLLGKNLRAVVNDQTLMLQDLNANDLAGFQRFAQSILSKTVN